MAAHAQVFLGLGGIHRHGLDLPFQDLGHGLAGQLGDLAFQRPHPRLARVIADHMGQRLVRHLELALAQPVCRDLLGQQVLARDLALFVLGVTRQRNDLHPVQQRSRHVIAVGRGHEHHVRQVVFHLEIVVHEGRVLFGIQHLEHRAGRVAAEVLAHLVDLVQQDQWVGGLGLFQRLDDLARHGPDIGPAVAADFGFVTHPAQRNADEFAPRGLGDRAAQRSLAHARRSDEAQDRPLQLLAAGLHRQVFDDPFLDLFQAIVIGIQDLFGRDQILAGARLDAPGQRQKPVEVVARHRRLGRHRRHRLQLLQLGFRLVACLLAELGAPDPLFQFGDLVLAVLAVAKLLLNGLHLLVQIVFALRLLHLGLDAGLDLLFDLQDRHLALHGGIDLFQALGHVQRVQQFLLAVQRDAHVPGDEIGQLGRLLRLGHGGHDLFGDVLADLDVTLELLGDGADQGRHRGGIARRFGQQDRGRLEVIVIGDKAGDLHALAPLDQHLDGAVGQLQQLQHIGQNAGAIDPVLGRLIDRGVLLRGQQDRRVRFHHRLQRADRFFAADEQRNDHVGKDHDVAQRQHRIARSSKFVHYAFLSARDHGPDVAAHSLCLRTI